MEDKKIDQLVNDVLDRIKESEAEAKSTENEKNRK